ncbi:hypothetical protein [Vulcanisaeta distributa]|uniref:hypothetical protein n=1 Tax=Vulcanisaeta distributa TaxID=164451 RepID=UPI000A639DAA|nr:hypothetical protein [Vulcanisaeta distributa]
MVNGNIYNNQLPQEYVNGLDAYALEPLPPSTYLAISYQNAYQTAFQAESQRALNNYQEITYQGILNNLYSGFINGTFGYKENYNGLTIEIGNGGAPLIEDITNYQDIPYLFISVGSGGGSGYMYLNWIIATFGVPYELIVP